MDFSKWHLGEPAMMMAVLQAGIAVAVGFGLHWTAEQVTLVTALIAAAFGLVIRSQVSPVK